MSTTIRLTAHCLLQALDQSCAPAFDVVQHSLEICAPPGNRIDDLTV